MNTPEWVALGFFVGVIFGFALCLIFANREEEVRGVIELKEGDVVMMHDGGKLDKAIRYFTDGETDGRKNAEETK